MLHVAGVALLTLLINATTTGWLVRKLGLSQQSDLQKNMLVGATYRLQRSVDANIEILKGKRHFNNVDWLVLRDTVKTSRVRERFKMFKSLNLIDEADLPITSHT